MSSSSGRMSHKKSKTPVPHWKPIVLSPRGRLRSFSPSERIYPLSQDPRYVLGGHLAQPPKSARVDKKPTASREYEEYQYPGLTKNLISDLDRHRFQLEDLRISGQRKKDEMARLSNSQWCPRRATEAPTTPETVNKKLMREESVTDLCALPDMFIHSSNDSKSTKCLNKRVFTASSLQDLKAIPSIEAKSNASNHNAYNGGRRVEYGTLSLDDLRALPSLSCYYENKEKSDDTSTAKEIEKGAVTPPNRDLEDADEDESPQK